MPDLLDFAATIVTAATPLLGGPVGPLDVPNLDRLLANSRIQAESEVFYADGSPAGTTAGRLSEWTPIDEFPLQFRQAIRASEDARFYEHEGVDPLAIARAVIGFATVGRQVGGGSTITQQVVKNILLDASQSIDRKLTEGILAVLMDDTMAKDDILELYVNAIYFGRGTYGAGPAAQVYFGRDWNQLSTGEIAFLAGVIQTPSALDPAINPERAVARRDYVLRQMHDLGMLTDRELEAALVEPLEAVDRVFEDRVDTWIAHAFSRSLSAYVGADTAIRGNLEIESTIDPDVQALVTRLAQSHLAEFDGFHAAGMADLSDGLSEADWSVAEDVLPRVPLGWRRAIVVGEVSGALLPVALPDGTSMALDLANQSWGADEIEAALELGSVVLLSPSEAAGKANDDMPEGVPLLGEGSVADAAAAIADGTKLARDAAGSAQIALEGLAPAEITADWVLETQPERQIAVVVMETQTGNVRGLVGGYDPGLSEFDRTHSIRQPGSSIKPLLYLAALNEGMAHDQLVLDLPLEIRTSDGLWTPANYGGDFVGTIPMYRALELSINLVAARLAYELGVDTFANMAEAAGAYPPGEMEQVISAALGSVGTTPMAMASAYATIANGGYPVRGTMAALITDPITGQPVWEPSPGWGLPPDRTGEPIADPEAVETLISMLRGVTTRGTAAGSFAAFAHPVAGKTGTSQDYRDAWFIGFTPEMVVAVWVGRDDNRPMGRGNTGGEAAAPLAVDIFQALYDTGVISQDGNYGLLAGGGTAGEGTGAGAGEGGGQFTGTGGLY